MGRSLNVRLSGDGDSVLQTIRASIIAGVLTTGFFEKGSVTY